MWYSAHPRGMKLAELDKRSSHIIVVVIETYTPMEFSTLLQPIQLWLCGSAELVISMISEGERHNPECPRNTSMNTIQAFAKYWKSANERFSFLQAGGSVHITIKSLQLWC